MSQVYTTRSGHLAFLGGHGPLSKHFRVVSIKPREYLVFATDLRYRMDFDDDGKPIEHPLDLIETV